MEWIGRISTLLLLLAWLSAGLGRGADVEVTADTVNKVALGVGAGGPAGPGTCEIFRGVTVDRDVAGPGGYALEASDNGWVVTNYGSVIARQDNSLHFLLNGSVLNFSLILSQGGDGVHVVGGAGTLTNYGGATIRGSGDGVEYEAGGTLVNWGYIVGGTNGAYLYGADSTLTNYGTIEGLGAEGVILGGVGDGNNHQLVNYGVIVGNDIANNLSVSMGFGDDTVTLKDQSRILNGDIDFDLGADTLNLDGGGRVDFFIFNAEALRKREAGRWSVERDLDLGAGGDTQVLGGDLAMNAALVSPAVTIAAAGTLSGNCAISGAPNAVLTCNGAIAPGNLWMQPFGTIAVTGDVTFNAGSLLSVDVGPGGACDTLQATGTINLNADTVMVNETGGILLHGARRPVVVADTALNGEIRRLEQQPSLFVSFYQGVSDGRLWITAARTPYATAAADDNQAALAEAIDRSIERADGDFALLLNRLDFLSLPEVQSAYRQMQPEPLEELADGAFRASSRFAGGVGARLRSRAAGLASPLAAASAPARFLSAGLEPDWMGEALMATDAPPPPAERDWQAFLQVTSAEEGREDSEERTGYDSASEGFLFGLDRRMNAEWLLGFAVGASDTESEWDGGRGGSRTKSLRLGPYLHRRWRAFEFYGTASYAHEWNEAKRRIAIVEIQRIAQSEWESDAVGLAAGVRYGRECGRWTLSPEAGLLCDRLDAPKVIESGAESLDCRIDSRTLSSLRHELGLRAATRLPWKRLLLTPEAWGGWRHEYLDRDRSLRLRLAGAPDTPFRLTLPGAVSDTWYAGAGLSAAAGERLSAHLRFEAEGGDGTLQTAWTGGLTLAF